MPKLSYLCPLFFMCPRRSFPSPFYWRRQRFMFSTAPCLQKKGSKSSTFWEFHKMIELLVESIPATIIAIILFITDDQRDTAEILLLAFSTTLSAWNVYNTTKLVLRKSQYLHTHQFIYFIHSFPETIKFRTFQKLEVARILVEFRISQDSKVSQKSYFCRNLQKLSWEPKRVWIAEFEFWIQVWNADLSSKAQKSVHELLPFYSPNICFQTASFCFMIAVYQRLHFECSKSKDKLSSTKGSLLHYFTFGCHTWNELLFNAIHRF